MSRDRLDNTFYNQDPHTDELSILHDGRAIITFHADGRIDVDESLRPSEAAAKVLDALRDQFRHLRNPRGDA